MSALLAVLVIIAAYLIGSLSSAIVLCRIMGLPDPRTQGSRNPGATNVLRIGGKKAAALTLLGDMLKGTLPVLAARWLPVENNTLALVAFAAFLGHLFPLFFRFQGGKGVATAIGGLLALNWPTALCWIATWITIALIFRYSSLAALTATLLAPIYLWLFTKDLFWTITIVCMGFILIIRHQDNIKKLITGTENRIGKKPSL